MYLHMISISFYVHMKLVAHSCLLMHSELQSNTISHLVIRHFKVRLYSLS